MQNAHSILTVVNHLFDLNDFVQAAQNLSTLTSPSDTKSHLSLFSTFALDMVDFDFLHLPFDIREIIYGLLLVKNTGTGRIIDHTKKVAIRGPVDSRLRYLNIGCLSLLLTCRQVHAEATEILYGQHEFVAMKDADLRRCWLPIIGLNSKYIRKLFIHVPCDWVPDLASVYGLSWMDGCVPDERVYYARPHKYIGFMDARPSLWPLLGLGEIDIGALWHRCVREMPVLRKVTVRAEFLGFREQEADWRWLEYQFFMLWVAGYFVQEHPTLGYAKWTESWKLVDLRGALEDTGEQVTFTVNMRDKKDKAVRGGSCERPLKNMPLDTKAIITHIEKSCMVSVNPTRYLLEP